MKVGAVSLVLLSALPGAAASPISLASTRRTSPISRVVELLTGLSGKVEADLKEQEGLYEDYVCWGKRVVDSKSSSNEKAKTRIDHLEAYVEDLAAGRVELTTERTDLVTELAEFNRDIEAMKAQREQENSDYEAAKDEMETGIAALEDAMEVLKEATKDKKDGSLLGLRGSLKAGFSERSREAGMLAKASEIAQRALSRGDALFLQRLLTGDVSAGPDRKKLNRKATFKMSYKQRSGKIQDTLAGLLSDFKENLRQAENREKTELALHENLLGSKESMKEKAEDALETMVGEGGASGLSKTETEDEVADLKTQVDNDERYMSETKGDLESMKESWKTRKELMVGEVAAINKAIAILHSDDARDLFKRSLSFVQLSRTSRGGSNAQQRLRSAVQIVRATARSTSDDRLAAFASFMELSARGRFDKVVEKIDAMIKLLEDEDTKDAAAKEQCESEREDNTKQAQVTAHAIDELTDKISTLKDDIDEAKVEVEEKESEIKSIEKELSDAKRLREEEHAAWKQSDADDKAAAELVASAAQVLGNFYKDNGLNLAQRRVMKNPPTVEAGEAPPPPPQTWEGDYGGASEESNGIVGILEKIKEDVDKDRAEAKTREDTAQSNFDSLKADSESQISTLDGSITDLTTTISNKEDEVGSSEEERGTKKKELSASVAIIKENQEGCDFILVNFDTRTKNRQAEREGLNKAKEILEAE